MLTKGPHYTALIPQLTTQHHLYPSLWPQALHPAPPETYTPRLSQSHSWGQTPHLFQLWGDTQSYSVHCRWRNQEQRGLFHLHDYLLILDECFLTLWSRVSKIQSESKKKNLGKVKGVHGNNTQINKVEETENHWTSFLDPSHRMG